MSHSPWQRLAMTILGAGAIGWAAVGVAQDSPTKSEKRTQERVNKAIKGSPEDGRISGVIVKLEPYRKDVDRGTSERKTRSATKEEAPHRMRLTINPLAVWRDYVRDQANPPKKAESSKSKSGENSIATKGEPIDPTNLVVVDIGPETRLATRFRSSTDETDPGSQSIAAAEAKDKGPKDTSKKTSRTSRNAARPPATHLEDFKKGMFVEVEFRRSGGLNAASHATILKPIGGADTPASESEPK